MKRILYFLLSLPLLTGCYEDKSSDRYEPIGSIIITDIEEEYNLISFIDELRITPAVTSADANDKPDKFEYLWTLFSNDKKASLPPDTLERESKDLSYVTTLSPGSYTILLRVTNPANGYVVYASATLIVNSQFSTGYYFLKETTEGNTELDFLTLTGGLEPNLLERKTGAPIIGAPTRIGYFTSYSYLDAITAQFVPCSALVPMGGNDMKVMKIENMSLIYEHKTIFYGEEPGEKPLMTFNDLFSRPYYISSKGLYMSNQMPRSGPYGTGKYGIAIEPDGGASLSPNTIVSGYMYNFFDELNGRLVYYNYNAKLQTMSSDNGFDPNDIKHTLLFIGTNGWAVFGDKANPHARYLYQLDLSTSRNPITEIRTIDPALHFGKAQVYGSNKIGSTEMLYAGVGDKLYMYNTAFDQEADSNGSPETFFSPKGMGSGEQITMITHKPEAPSDYLMIGTYKDGNYKVYMYTLSGGMPYGDPVIVAAGKGKVIDVQYVSTDILDGYNVNY